jgi:hypothetical protein
VSTITSTSGTRSLEVMNPWDTDFMKDAIPKMGKLAFGIDPIDCAIICDDGESSVTFVGLSDQGMPLILRQALDSYTAGNIQSMCAFISKCELTVEGVSRAKHNPNLPTGVEFTRLEISLEPSSTENYLSLAFVLEGEVDPNSPDEANREVFLLDQFVIELTPTQVAQFARELYELVKD